MKDKKALPYHLELLSGGIAGSIAKTVIAPLERGKMIFQVTSTMKFSYFDFSRLLQNIYETSGLVGLWRGHSATLIRILPYSSISYASFNIYKQLLWDNEDVLSVKQRIVSGSMAGATSVIFTYPLDLLRTRVACAYESMSRKIPLLDVEKNHFMYIYFFEKGTAKYGMSYTDIIKKSYHSDGLASFYAGLRPTLLGIVPYAGISYAIYDTIKSKTQTIPQKLIAGGFAGCVAQTVTYPLDMVRKRIQVCNFTISKSSYYAPLEFKIAQNIYRNEGGFRALYKGISVNWIKSPIVAAISFTVNDGLREYFKRQ